MTILIRKLDEQGTMDLIRLARDFRNAGLELVNEGIALINEASEINRNRPPPGSHVRSTDSDSE